MTVDTWESMKKSKIEAGLGARRLGVKDPKIGKVCCKPEEIAVCGCPYYVQSRKLCNNMKSRGTGFFRGRFWGTEGL